MWYRNRAIDALTREKGSYKEKKFRKLSAKVQIRQYKCQTGAGGVKVQTEVWIVMRCEKLSQ